MTIEQTDRSWAEAQLALRGTVDGWIRSAIHRQSGSPWKGGHDEANYTCSWTGHYLLTGDEHIKEFLLWLRDSYRDWSAEHEYHGFRADARDYVTHSFENHMGFISALCEMDPADTVNDALIEHVAHHIGNWEEGVPDWYDWDKHQLVAHWLGTKEAKNYPPWNFTTTRHARVARLALKAWQTSGKQRYLDWCDDFLGRWCDEIMAAEERIPINLYMTPPDQTTDEQWAQTPHPEAYRDPYQGDRWAGAIHEILRLMFEAYPIIPNDRYLEAVRKAVTLCEPVAAMKTGLITTMLGYRDLTRDNCFDEKIDQWHRESLMPRLDGAIDGPMPDTLIGPLDGSRKAFGIDAGDGTIRVYGGPMAREYKMGYDASGGIRYLARAMQLADRCLALSAAWVRDGREHGCGAGRYMHGEGAPAALLLQSTTGIDRVLYYDTDGTPGLDKAVAVLARPAADGLTLTFVNTAAGGSAVQISARDPDKRITAVQSDDAWVEVIDGRATVELPPEAGACVRLVIAPNSCGGA